MDRLYRMIVDNKSSLLLYLFLISIFFFRIPNFYIFPPVHNSFLTAQAIARVLLVVIFCFKILERFRNKEGMKLTRLGTFTLIFILLFFSLESLSIISAANPTAFIERYKDLVLGILSFFVFYFFRKEYKKIIVVLVAPFYINIVYQTVMIFANDLYAGLAKWLVYDKHLSFVLYNLDRGRIYIDSYDESFLPLIFLKEINLGIYTKSFFILGISFFALLSNFRTRILMLVFGLFSALFILIREKLKSFLYLLLAIIIVGFIVNALAIQIAGVSFYDRFLFGNQLTDFSTILSRVNQTQNALLMGRASLFGVGLGNYYDNLPAFTKVYSPLNSPGDNTVEQGGRGYVHNIFASTIAESGYISFAVLMIILALFVKNDWNIFKNNIPYRKAVVICFWTLFIYSVFNPNVAGSYQVFFWGLRGLLL